MVSRCSTLAALPVLEVRVGGVRMGGVMRRGEAGGRRGVRGEAGSVVNRRCRGGVGGRASLVGSAERLRICSNRFARSRSS